MASYPLTPTTPMITHKELVLNTGLEAKHFFVSRDFEMFSSDVSESESSSGEESETMLSPITPISTECDEANHASRGEAKRASGHVGLYLHECATTNSASLLSSADEVLTATSDVETVYMTTEYKEDSMGEDGSVETGAHDDNIYSLSDEKDFESEFAALLGSIYSTDHPTLSHLSDEEEDLEPTYSPEETAATCRAFIVAHAAYRERVGAPGDGRPSPSPRLPKTEKIERRSYASVAAPRSLPATTPPPSLASTTSPITPTPDFRFTMSRDAASLMDTMELMELLFLGLPPPQTIPKPAFSPFDDVADDVGCDAGDRFAALVEDFRERCWAVVACGYTPGVTSSLRGA